MSLTDKNTLEGLRHAIDYSPPRPPLPDASTARSWTDEQWADFEDARLAYVLDGLRVGVPVVQTAIKQTRRLVLINSRNSGGRQLLVLDARPSSGKTETAMACAKAVEADERRRNPDYREEGVVPVAWCDVRSGASGKRLSEEMHRFFVPGLEMPRAWSNARYLDSVVDQLTTHAVKLLVIDEAHLIAARTGLGAQGEASDNIKELQNRTNVTVILAGVDLMDSGVLTTQRASQLTSRAHFVPLAPATMTTAPSRTAWGLLCHSFDELLPLRNYEPGILRANSDELHRATGGILGNLAEFCRHLFLDIISESDPALRDERITARQLQGSLSSWASTRLNVSAPGKVRAVVAEEEHRVAVSV